MNYDTGPWAQQVGPHSTEAVGVFCNKGPFRGRVNTGRSFVIIQVLHDLLGETYKRQRMLSQHTHTFTSSQNASLRHSPLDASVPNDQMQRGQGHTAAHLATNSPLPPPPLVPCLLLPPS